MTMREIRNAMAEIEAKMTDPEMVVAKIENGKVVFENGCTYSLITKERVM